jgi:hypothetical protein
VSIASVSIHSIDHELELVVLEEESGLVSILRKVHEEDVAYDGDDCCDDAFPDEDPYVTAQSADVIAVNQVC